MRESTTLVTFANQSVAAAVPAARSVARVPGCALIFAAVAALATPFAAAQADPPAARQTEVAPLSEAQRLFYSAHYEAAAALMLAPCTGGGTPACELRSAALLFRIRREMGESTERKKAWSRCGPCPELLVAFQATNAQGRALAKAALLTRPDDEETLFLLSKLALNHVWLELGVLGHKTGWNEYWEARKTLDRILDRNPGHVRARVARAWIDYIVDTKMPRGTRWVLGGGNKKRGLLAVREAATADAAFFVLAEARFALWDMQVRERNLEGAVATARSLIRDFPENSELHRFLGTHEGSSPREER